MQTTDQTGWWGASLDARAETAPLVDDVTTDLAIIGGGYTGCAAALEAARLGASVVLLEAEDIGFGGSGRNVGLVNSGLWLPPDKILAALGRAQGEKLMAVLAGGPDCVFQIIASEKISCAPVRKGTLHLAHARSGLNDLRTRFKQGKQYGADFELLDREETRRRTGSEVFFGALFNPHAGTIQPLAYCHGLATAAIRFGARLFTGSPVRGMERSGNGWVLHANGARVRAKYLLNATNAYAHSGSKPERPNAVPVWYSQWATEPLPDDLKERVLPGGEGCWDTDLIMSSFRLDNAGRLIIGGMGNNSGPAGQIHENWVRRKLRAIYPALADLRFTHSWSGCIAMTRDHLPRILRVGPNALSIFGYSGRGIAPGTLFGSAAAKALLQNNEDALPLPVIDDYAEPFTYPKTLFFEFGATLNHAVKARF